MHMGERIDPLEIYNAFGWLCHVCSGPIDPLIKHPDPMCATLDHLVELSRGGQHTRENLLPAHKYCNQERDRCRSVMEANEDVW